MAACGGRRMNSLSIRKLRNSVYTMLSSLACGKPRYTRRFQTLLLALEMAESKF
jgi:hypothetical protein